MKFVKVDKNSPKRKLQRSTDEPQLTLKDVGKNLERNLAGTKKSGRKKSEVDTAETDTSETDSEKTGKGLSLPRLNAAPLLQAFAGLAASARLEQLRPEIDSVMSPEEKKNCSGIIHTASAAAGGIGAGLAQLPGSDNMIITPIQLTMTIALGKVFGRELSDSAARAAIASAAASTIGRAVSQVLVGWIPGVGNAVNCATAASITEIMGWSIASDFAKKRN